MRYIPLVGLLMLMSQCTRQEPELSPTITNLIGAWRLLEPASPYAVTLQFAFDTDNPPQDITPFKANGKSSVNSYTVRLYAALDGMMLADPVSSTKMAGSPEAMLFEQTYLTNLKAVARYELNAANQLRLYHGGGGQPGVLVYEKVN